MQLRVHRRPARVPRRGPRPARPRSARPRTCATRGRTTTGRVPGLWDAARRDGRASACSRPRRDGGLGLTDASTSCSCSRRPAGYAVPEPIVETAAVGVPLLGRADLTVAAATSSGAVGRHRRRDRHRRRPLRSRRRSSSSPRPSVDGARRLFEVRGTPDAGRRRRGARGLRPRRRAEPRRSSAGSPTACSR